MNLGNGDQVGLILGVEGIQVGLMLEVVGIQIAVFYGVVGLHIVIELLDFQGPAVLFQNLCNLTENLGMGSRGSAHLNNLVVLLGAGTQAQHQSQAQDNCKYFFHCKHSFFIADALASRIHFYFLLRRRLSHLFASQVPTLWKICTSSTRPITATHITRNLKL